MWSKYFVACILLTSSIFHCIGTTTDQPNMEMKKQFTKCERDIVEVMCKDYKDDIAKCADEMPSDEKPFWHDCAGELKISDARKWIPILNSICSKGVDAVEMAWNCSTCWSNKIIENLDKINDNVYPVEYFDCCDKIYKGAVKKTDCNCQLEKLPLEPCSSAPKPAMPF